MHWFFSSKNIVIMMCRSGRHRSVANAELWSNTLTRCSRHQHSASLLHLSELDFSRNCSGCTKHSLRVFQTRYDQVQADCLRRVPVPDPVTRRWKRSRPEHAEGSSTKFEKKQGTSATATPAESNLNRGILDELAERLGNFHDSARALASCLQNHNVSRETDQSMIEAAKCMFNKLLGGE